MTNLFGKDGFPLDLGATASEPRRTLTDEFLEIVELAPYNKEQLARIPALRHKAVQRSVAYLANHATSRAVEMVQTFLSAEVRYADPFDPKEEKFADEAFDIIMGCFPEIRPTFSFVTPEGVDLLRDDRLATRYLELMLQDTGGFDNWQPVIDWAALHNEGGVEGVVETSQHNHDIIAMKQWSERFSHHPVGEVVLTQLDAIEAELPSRIHSIAFNS